MIKAVKSDRALVVAILAGSFENNKSVNYIVQQDKRRLERMRALMEYSFDVCYLFGEVWLSADQKACALILFPQLKKTTLVSTWLDIKLIFKAIGIGRIQTALQRESKIKKLQLPGEMCYLWFIGVSTESQHQGIGSKLLAAVLSYADQKRLPVCLETSTLKNIPWYEHFGFKLYNQLELGYTLYFLKKEPGK